jgi:hypothetical protein
MISLKELLMEGAKENAALDYIINDFCLKR